MTTWEYTCLRYISFGILAALACFAITIGVSILARSLDLSTCSSPRLRAEWRTLMPEEKQNYIQAVQCLQNSFSSLTGIGTLYDDFSYIHMHLGRNTHKKASFFPWHRAFLHLYEMTLTKKCGYNGLIPYWAWELDWQKLEHSPIWDSTDGFGNEGDTNSGYTPGYGHCVIDGPFKNTQRIYFDGLVWPHCLGRAFVNIKTKQNRTLYGDSLSPERIIDLVATDNYDEFRNWTESAFHNVIHNGIRGDFSTFVAANDPIFWLHHAQLDRLWWQWQQADPTKRLTEYSGTTSNMSAGSQNSATLDDKLNFLGMWEDIKVSEVMRTDGGILCYRY